MNQMKYLITACLLGVTIVTSIFLFSFLSKTGFFPATPESEMLSSGGSGTGREVPEKFPEGKRLFQQNCQSCHSLYKNGTAPGLRGFTERGPWGDKKNVLAWVRNPAAFMKNDPYTQELQKQYGVTMQAFPQITEEEIQQIIGYLSQPAPKQYSYLP